ncbi:MAG: bacillithiol biosynthesis cysteine-adding enzyme BshC [Bacteroidota bacterium]
MELKKLTLEEANNFNSLFLDYISQKPDLSDFYDEFPTVAGLFNALKKRNFPDSTRSVLADSFRRQYEGFTVSEAVKQNIELLKSPDTFTITTGHQLNVFTGPLYYIYKLVTVINTTKKLKEAYPQYNFVPVYWMASEDHDFDEINHFNLFGKKYVWETDQQGAVGRFDTSSISELIDQLPEEVPMFRKAYEGAANLAAAVRSYVNDLFGEEGLLIIDPDDQPLKSLFTRVIEEDVLRSACEPLAVENTNRLEKLGYKGQVHPREINFFYMKGDVRERIVRDGAHFQVLNTGISFSETKMQDLITNEPEVFSPNVILRPLFQETILPNLAYVGGPSEAVYWLQLKSIFDNFETPFPALMPRNFALVVNAGSRKKIEKVGLSYHQLFYKGDQLKKHYVRAEAENEFHLKSEKKELSEFFEKLKEKAAQIDGSLQGFIGAEQAKTLKSIDNIEKRLRKSEEQKHETALKQIEGIKEKLFPNGGLQERHDNFLNFYLNNPGFVQELLDSFDPFDYQFNLLIDG